MKILEAALEYHKNGFSVIPLWSPEEIHRDPSRYNWLLQEEMEANNKRQSEPKKGKEPLSEEEVRKKVFNNLCKLPIISSWEKYQNTLPSEEELIGWFTEYPDANIAVITGKISNVFVVDIDSMDVFNRLKQENRIPKTPMVTTGKGYHLYIKYPNYEVRNKSNTKIKIDIRGQGGYVVAPFSTHGTGRQYSWVEGRSIFDIETAPCEGWIADYLKGIDPFQQKNPEAEKAVYDLHSDLETIFSDVPQIIAAASDKAKTDFATVVTNGCDEGERNDTATRLIGRYLGKGLTPDEVWTIIQDWNQKNNPPMSESELRKTFESILQSHNNNTQKKQEIDITSFLDSPERIISNYTENHVVIPFGGDNLVKMNEHMNGGLLGGRTYTFGGIPTAGKTAHTNNIADNICLSGYPVWFFSYDDGRTELVNRTFARFSDCGIEQFNTRTLSKEVILDICKKPEIQQIQRLKYVAEVIIAIEDWDPYIEKIYKKHDKPPVIIVDYLRKLRTKRNINDERMRIDTILIKLTEIAKRYNNPILIISELARDSYKGGQRLSLASFKESGLIEYESSWCGILASVEEVDGEFRVKDNWESIIKQDESIDLIVFKSKRGAGKTGKIPLKINRNKMTVSDRVQPVCEDKIFEVDFKKSKFE
ncbi:MAG: bifunctional DNA primase/polymerase [Pseudomonadota bacterium]